MSSAHRSKVQPIEAGVVPVADQDAVLDAAAFEREAHVRAAIVEGKDAPTIVDDKDWAVVAVHDEPALRPELLKARRAHEFLVRRIHHHTSPGAPALQAAGPDLKIGILLLCRLR